MFKESLATGAKTNLAARVEPGAGSNREKFTKKAPIWIGRLFALSLIAFVTSERYHSEEGFDNTLPEPRNSRELDSAQLATLSINLLANYPDIFESITATPTPTPTPTETFIPEPTLSPTETPEFSQKENDDIQVQSPPVEAEQGELSRITGYYCQQVPGYPVGDGGGWCGTTASGEPVAPGVAACGYYWDLGTKLRIAGFGEVVCLDRGNLDWKQVDIFFPTNKDLYESGKPDFAQVTEVE